MSNCEVCRKAFVCDWETPPDNCLDFERGCRLDAESQVHDNLDEECEVLTRGGGKSIGVIRGMDGEYILLHRPDQTLEVLDTSERLLVRRRQSR